MQNPLATTPTVDGVLKAFNKTLTQLETVKTKNEQKAQAARERIQALEVEAQNEEREARRAEKVRARISALLTDDE